MSLTHLVRHKGLTLLLCLLIALVLSPSVPTWASDKAKGSSGDAGASATKDKDKECGPVMIKDKDGTIHIKPGGKEGRCNKHLAANGEDGICKSGPNSYACNVEGMIGCDATLANGGTCTTFDTGGGVCQCACQ